VKALPVLFVLAACGGPSRATAPDELPEPPIPQAPAGNDRAQLEKETSWLEGVATRTCACKDAACVTASDAELVQYARTTTMNDPVTDLETWPADLDARGRRAIFKIYTCMAAHGVASRAPSIYVLRKTAAFRERTCACTDVECAREVRAKLVEFLTQDAAHVNLDEADSAAFTDEAAAAKRCLETVFAPRAQQLILDMRSLRREACACADSACAAAVTARVEQAVRELGDAAADEATTQELKEVSAEVRTCLDRARGTP
jgi:hypothetical protein